MMAESNSSEIYDETAGPEQERERVRERKGRNKGDNDARRRPGRLCDIKVEK